MSGTRNIDEIRYREIHKFFQRRHLLDGVSLSLQGGAAILLSGENGSGKTTLLKILSGLEKPARCMVDFGLGDTPWSKCRKQLQQQVMYLHQQPYLFAGNVIRNLALALPRTMPAARRNRKIRQALEWAQLDGIAETRRKRCRAARSSECPWPGRGCGSRESCFWTSPSPTWIGNPGRGQSPF